MSGDSMDKVLSALDPVINKLEPSEAQAVRESLDKFAHKLKEARIVGEAGAGLVKITTNGGGDPISVEIDDMVFKETEKQLVSDLFCAAIRDNQQKCQENARAIEAELQREIMMDKLEGLGNKLGGSGYTQ